MHQLESSLLHQGENLMMLLTQTSLFLDGGGAAIPRFFSELRPSSEIPCSVNVLAKAIWNQLFLFENPYNSM